MNTTKIKAVTVTEAEPCTRARFQATLTEWDLWIPVGYGNTIQEALESFLESWELKYDRELNYKWS